MQVLRSLSPDHLHLEGGLFMETSFHNVNIYSRLENKGDIAKAIMNGSF